MHVNSLNYNIYLKSQKYFNGWVFTTLDSLAYFDSLWILYNLYFICWEKKKHYKKDPTVRTLVLKIITNKIQNL